MKQEYKKNNNYEIMTPNGWEDFEGIIKNTGKKAAKKIIFADFEIVATLDHRFYVNGHEETVSNLVAGLTLDGDVANKSHYTILDIKNTELPTSFDIFNSKTHKICVTNGVFSHQCDEFAFIMPSKQKEFWTSIRPVLSTGGSCIITSTPKNDEDIFAEIFKGAEDNIDEYGNILPGGVGKNGFFPVRVPWYEHPDRDAAWEKLEREQLGEARFQQEHLCAFVTNDETLINPLTLPRLSGKQPEYFTGTVRWYQEPVPNKTYLIGLDPSLGTGGDNSALQVFQLPEMVQIAEWQHNNTAPRGKIRVLMQTLIYLESVLHDNPAQIGEPELFWTVENNTIGEAILQIIEDTGEERFPGIFISEKKRKGSSRRFRKGMNTNKSNKLSACARLKSLIESGRMIINSKNLIKELKNFVAKEASFGAKSGETDDLIMAVILVVRMLDIAVNWSVNAIDIREYIDDDELDEVEPIPILL